MAPRRINAHSKMESRARLRKNDDDARRRVIVCASRTLRFGEVAPARNAVCALDIQINSKARCIQGKPVTTSRTKPYDAPSNTDDVPQTDLPSTFSGWIETRESSMAERLTKSVSWLQSALSTRFLSSRILSALLAQVRPRREARSIVRRCDT
jgi:hypothetical protein